jgi:hypothetical protein
MLIRAALTDAEEFWAGPAFFSEAISQLHTVGKIRTLGG